jgi:hypothetical protein
MDETLGMPVDERVMMLAALHSTGNSSVVESVLSRTGGAELRELASHAIVLLADSREELADLNDSHAQA